MTTKVFLALCLTTSLLALAPMAAFAAPASVPAPNSTLPALPLTARFHWAPTGKAVREFRITIGKQATIWDGPAVIARCSVEPAHGVVFMQCRDAHFSRLATPAALFAPLRAGQPPTLRFGSWVTGYEEAALELESPIPQG